MVRRNMRTVLGVGRGGGGLQLPWSLGKGAAVMSDTICWLGWCLAWCLVWDSGVGWLPLPQIGKQAGPSSLNTSTAELKHLTDLEW